ncbi:MAG: carbamoyltransferase HypF [Campylobacterota bacterium]
MVNKKLEVTGVVQGVGFRPYVYNLALKYDIKGWVNNDSNGVNIALYCSIKNFEKFLLELKTNPPKLARVDSIKIKNQQKKIYSTFQIKKSTNSKSKTTMISPDMSICDECILDINDKDNFRYNYALTNCTNCGPRYSIIETVPYDRCNTSMKDFNLCPLCKQEYKNPTNRRYHAQPVACEKCGPKISLYDNKNCLIKNDIEAIKNLAKLINQGDIVALKGLGGFHIVCDALNEKVVSSLRQRKNRPKKPFAVMFKNLDEVRKYTKPTKKELECLNSKEKPIVLLKSSNSFKLSKSVCVDISKIGCFLPYTALHHILFRYLNNPIVATSANLKDEPIIKSKDELIQKLGFVVDYVLDFNREIINSCDDSVMQVINEDICKLRNARGYAPTLIKLNKKIDKKVLALGANQKSTITIVFEDNLILSPYIGDLNTIESVEYFERTIQSFKRFYEFEPDIVVCDNHPNYESTKWAKDNYADKLVQVQHHYSHILSTMAEYKLNKKVLGIAFDGTGFGDDGNIWGGEVFICDKKSYKREYHIEYFKLLGAQKAIKEPKRVALSMLFDIYSKQEVKRINAEVLKAFDEKEIELYYTMHQKDLNSILTSSMGRVFDGVASLANIAHIQSYEGQTGLLLEEYYNENIKESYGFEIDNGIINIKQMIKQIIYDNNKELIATKFINTIVKLIVKLSKKHEELPVILSGGVFQNQTLLTVVLKELKNKNIEVYFSKQIPLNDEGISVGQAYHTL